VAEAVVRANRFSPQRKATSCATTWLPYLADPAVVSAGPGMVLLQQATVLGEGPLVYSDYLLIGKVETDNQATP
jgi:hypothetical protein